MINPELKIDHVHLKVSNLEKSIQFYRSILGFKIVRQESKTAFLSSSPSENKASPTFLIALSESKDSAVSIFRRKPSVAGLYHFAILLPERRYLAYFLKHLQKNLDPEYYEGMADHAVSESIYIHDPDFIGIEVYRDRNPSEWKWNDNTVHMITEPLNVKDLFKEAIDMDNKWKELPAKTSIGHVHLHVSNLTKAKKFYQEILQLNHTATYPGAYFFAANKYHHHVATNTWLGENISLAYSDDNNKPGLDHYAIKLNNKNDLFFLKDRLLEFKIDIDNAYSIENDDRFSTLSFYGYDFDKIKIQFLSNNL